MTTNLNNLINGLNPNQGERITSAIDNFKAFMTQGVSLAQLKEGQYQATCKLWKFVEPEVKPGEQPKKPYVRFELVMKHDGRLIVHNVFEKGMLIFLDQIKQQFGLLDTEIEVPDLLKIFCSQEFTVWVSYAEVLGQTYRNCNFVAPKINIAAAKSTIEEEF